MVVVVELVQCDDYDDVCENKVDNVVGDGLENEDWQFDWIILDLVFCSCEY